MRFLLLIWPLLVESERIIVVNQPISVSHVRLLHTIIKELQNRGHQITELAWPLTDQVLERKPPPGVHAIRFNNGVGSYRASLLQSYIDEWAWLRQDTTAEVLSLILRHTIVNFDFYNLVVRWLTVAKLLIEPCLEFINDADLERSLKEGNYTLAIVDPIAHACSWVTINELNVPYVAVSNFMEHYQMNLALGIPCPFSYVPATMDPKPLNLDFFGRLTNSFQHYTFEILHRSLLVYARLVAGPTSRWYNDTTLHASMALMNAQRYFDDYPRPVSMMLHTFNIANGAANQKLSKEFSEFVDDPNSKGTVILSMSTTTSSARMGADVQRAIIDAFIRFPNYRFIWRIDDGLAGLNHTHTNVRTWNWIPQQALLNHHKTRILITHGGINSILEAMNHAIPMLVVPLFGDQYPNAARVAQHGIGRVLYKNQVNKEVIEKQLKELLSSDSYQKRVNKMSEMMNSQQKLENMRDSHIFWIEFTSKHRDQMHRLQPKGASLSHFRYFNLDLLWIFIFLSALILVSFVMN